MCFVQTPNTVRGKGPLTFVKTLIVKMQAFTDQAKKTLDASVVVVSPVRKYEYVRRMLKDTLVDSITIKTKPVKLQAKGSTVYKGYHGYLNATPFTRYPKVLGRKLAMRGSVRFAIHAFCTSTGSFRISPENNEVVVESFQTSFALVDVMALNNVILNVPLHRLLESILMEARDVYREEA